MDPRMRGSPSQMPKVPRRLTSDTGSVPLSAQEQHLLSLVDGVLDDQELAFVTGTNLSELFELLERLAMLGLLAIDDRAGDGRERLVPTTARPPAPGDEDCDLDQETRRKINELYGRLATDDHYGLLGVARNATRKELKAAYYKLAPQFHPDKHFRKKLGSYKSKIEAIFARLTLAHDTLRSQMKRRTYDNTLPPSQSRAQGRAQGSSSPEAPGRDRRERWVPPDRSAPRVPKDPPPRAADAVKSSVEAQRAPVRPAPRPEPVPPRRPAIEPSQARKALRKALARKLSEAPVEERPSAVPPDDYQAPQNVKLSAAETLRARYDKIGREVRSRRSERYVARAEAALASGDFKTAAAAYRQAAQLDPDDPTLGKKAEEAARRAATVS